MPVLIKGGGGSGGGYKYQLGNIKNMDYSYNRQKLLLKWKDPDNLVIGGSNISEWQGTIVVCKQGSPPKSIEDGIIVTDISTKDAYKESSLEIQKVGEVGGEGYYYGIFPYTKDYVVNVDEANIIYWNFPSLQDMSWTEINQVVTQGNHANYWEVGQKKSISLTGDVTGNFEVQVADFDFYDRTDGRGKAGIVFTFTKNVIEDASVDRGQVYNSSGMNGGSSINMLEEEITKVRNSMPSELVPLIKKVNAVCSCGTTKLIVGGGANGVYGPGPNAVNQCRNSDIFPPSYAEVTNGGSFARRYAVSYSGYGDETVKEGSALELYKHGNLDDLSSGPLDKNGKGFLRTVYSTFQGYHPGYIYMKTFELNSEKKVSIGDVSLNYSLYSDSSSDIKCVGTGGTAGLCPMFCI